MEWKMDKVCGKKIKKKILISMKEDIKMIKSMDMENFNGVLEVNIKAIMWMIKKWDMVKCTGKTEQFIEDFGMKDNKMV